MKPKSRQELVQLSVAVFATVTASSLFATVDGNFFLHEDRANLHNGTIKGGKVYEIERSEAKQETPEASQGKKAKEKPEPKSELLKGSNADVAKAVETLNSVDELKVLLEDEKTSSNRIGAKKAIQERIVVIEAETTAAASKEDNPGADSDSATGTEDNTNTTEANATDEEE